MKNLLLIVLPLLLMVGCSKEPINYEETLNERDGVFYTKETNKPYSGPVFSLDEKGRNKRESILEDGKMITYNDFEWYENGKLHYKVTYKDGKEDGLQTWWYENGQKELKGTYKDGEEDGLHTYWHENGQKSGETTFKDGIEDGLHTLWHENGQKKLKGTYKDGKADGLQTWWYENGQKNAETTFKDGYKISEECWDEDGNEMDCPRW